MTEPTREAPTKKVSPDLVAAPIIDAATAPNLPARKASIDEFLRRNAEVLYGEKFFPPQL